MASKDRCLIQDVNLDDHSKGAHGTWEGKVGGINADIDLCGKPVTTTIKKLSQNGKYSDIDSNMKWKRVFQCEDRRDADSDVPEKFFGGYTKEEIMGYGFDIYDMVCGRNPKGPEMEYSEIRGREGRFGMICHEFEPEPEPDSKSDEDYLLTLELDLSDIKW